MDARKLVAWNLRRIRVEKKLPQEALAVDAAIDRTYVSRLERSLENPTVAVLERLSHALDVPIVEFFAAMPPNAKRLDVLMPGRKARSRVKRPAQK
jgi:transcriptional regulator with XRE-family HTH domain